MGKSGLQDYSINPPSFSLTQSMGKSGLQDYSINPPSLSLSLNLWGSLACKTIALTPLPSLSLNLWGSLACKTIALTPLPSLSLNLWGSLACKTITLTPIPSLSLNLWRSLACKTIALTPLPSSHSHRTQPWQQSPPQSLPRLTGTSPTLSLVLVLRDREGPLTMSDSRVRNSGMRLVREENNCHSCYVHGGDSVLLSNNAQLCTPLALPYTSKTS